VIGSFPDGITAGISYGASVYRLIKYRPHIITFLYHLEVPPDNNGSERVIRNVKVKQKISGQFKSLKGA
jgi:hypothetical protein